MTHTRPVYCALIWRENVPVLDKDAEVAAHVGRDGARHMLSCSEPADFIREAWAAVNHLKEATAPSARQGAPA